MKLTAFPIIFVTGIAVPASAGPVKNEMGWGDLLSAQGLAHVIVGEKHCGYQIDQTALEKYYTSYGLDTPKTLATISGWVAVAELDDAPSLTECTMAKMTAKNIGILRE